MFFFSSRRRHTRYWRDWSSDVCSSDLTAGLQGPAPSSRGVGRRLALPSVALPPGAVLGGQPLLALGDRLQRVLGLLAGGVRAQAVPLGAPVPVLHGVVLEAVEPRPLRHVVLPVRGLPTSRSTVGAAEIGRAHV